MTYRERKTTIRTIFKGTKEYIAIREQYNQVTWELWKLGDHGTELLGIGTWEWVEKTIDKE